MLYIILNYFCYSFAVENRCVSVQWWLVTPIIILKSKTLLYFQILPLIYSPLHLLTSISLLSTCHSEHWIFMLFIPYFLLLELSVSHHTHIFRIPQVTETWTINVFLAGSVIRSVLSVRLSHPSSPSSLATSPHVISLPSPDWLVNSTSHGRGVEYEAIKAQLLYPIVGSVVLTAPSDCIVAI